MRHFFSTPGRFVTSPGYSSGAVTTGTSSTARRPKPTNQPTNQPPTQPTTNHQPQTNETKQRTRTTRQTNQDRQQKPCNAAHSPYSRSMEGQARSAMLRIHTRTSGVFFLHQFRVLFEFAPTCVTPACHVDGRTGGDVSDGPCP